MTEAIEIRLKGALLLGAGRSRELHDTTLRRPDGAPYIPASALKGAIREQLVRLAGAEAARRIFGGQGFRQDVDPDSDNALPAQPERPGGGYTQVYLADAELDGDAGALFRQGFGTSVRPHVAIDRRDRRAFHQRLFQREVAGSPGATLRFRAAADLALLTPEDRDLFQAALGAVFALGSSRSRGLGWVDLALVQEDEGDGEPTTSPRPVAVPDAEELEIVFEALEPLSVGPLPFVGNFQPTLDFLPASTVRGAVVTAAMKRRGTTTDQSDDPAFRNLLLDPETCVRFGDAAPLSGSSAPRPPIAPATARVGKYRGEEAGITDTLVRDFVQRLLAKHGVLCPVFEEVVDASGARERAVHVSGRWLGGGAPARRVMTRVALDRRSARGKDGALYSVELLERGTHFAAPVHNAGPEARRLLKDAAAVALRAGHGRGQGYGRLRIVQVRPWRDEPLRERLESFDAHLRSRIAEAERRHGVTLEASPGHFLAALLVTDLLPSEDPGNDSAEAAFHAALRLPESRLLHGEVRAGHRGGFDTTRHRPRPFRPVVRAGSVLLLGIPDLGAETVEQLHRLERHGAGEGRDRGFGALRFSDPIHRKGETP